MAFAGSWLTDGFWYMLTEDSSGRADCRNDFLNRLQSSRADRKWFPAGQEQLVQSDGHWLHFRVEEMYRTEIAESVCLW